jgi:hypothetical protein
MGDFIPGYVSTFSDPTFNRANANLVIVGLENGKIYGSFNTKDEFLEIINAMNTTKIMMCYYSPLINFTIAELNLLSTKRIFLLNNKQLEKVRYAYQRTSSFF